MSTPPHPANRVPVPRWGLEQPSRRRRLSSDHSPGQRHKTVNGCHATSRNRPTGKRPDACVAEYRPRKLSWTACSRSSWTRTSLDPVLCLGSPQVFQPVVMLKEVRQADCFLRQALARHEQSRGLLTVIGAKPACKTGGCLR